MTDDNLTTKQAAKFCNVSVRFLDDLRRVGEGPSYIKLGYKTIRYRKSDLANWLENQTFNPISKNQF